LFPSSHVAPYVDIAQHREANQPTTFDTKAHVSPDEKDGAWSHDSPVVGDDGTSFFLGQ
jgi:hypothetical protein